MRRQVADPLGGLWESDILPLLVTRPGVRPVAVLEEMQRSHPDRDWHRLRRTLEWTTVFPDVAMTLAAVDRLVHHAVKTNVESYRQRSAAARQNRRGTCDSKRDIKHKEVITASST